MQALLVLIKECNFTDVSADECRNELVQDALNLVFDNFFEL